MIRIKRWVLTMALALLVAAGFAKGIDQVLPATMDRTPCDPQASADAGKILAWLGDLSMDVVPGVVSGQNCYHGNQLTATGGMDGYHQLVEKLHDQTGQWIGIIGVDYEYEKIFSPAELSQANKVLIDYGQAGGIVTINWAPLNPWITMETGGTVTIPKHDGPGGTRDLRKVKLDELITPGTAVYANWHKKLDRMAAALAELQDAGVVVLWRPLQEMNGSWFWWGMKSHTRDADAYGRVWRDMYRYFTEVKGLHNLLWVYSPNSAGPVNQAWTMTADWAWPGADYVDIVAGTAYSASLEIQDYKQYLKWGKPVAMGEYSPDGNVMTSGTFDDRLYAEKLTAKYPAVAYWVSWHNYPDLNWSVVANQNADTLLNDPRIINRDRMFWKAK